MSLFLRKCRVNQAEGKPRKENIVKQTFTVLLATATLVALVVLASTGVVQAQCSNATLTGNYAFHMEGYKVTQVGVATFDGAGNLSANYSGNDNGKPFTAADVGTYSVNPDCTGSFYDATVSATVNLAILGGGTEAYGQIATRGWNPETVTLKKQ